MGMTDDLEVALSEGSTMIRIGRALFGERPPRHRDRLTGPVTAPAGPERSTRGSDHALRCRREEHMATSFIKKSMAYLGLVDDYDDYDDYDSRPAPVAHAPAPGRGRARGRAARLPTGRIRVTGANGPADRWPPRHRGARPPGHLPVGQDLHPGSPVPGCTSWPRPGLPTPSRSPTGS